MNKQGSKENLDKVALQKSPSPQKTLSNKIDNVDTKKKDENSLERVSVKKQDLTHEDLKAIHKNEIKKSQESLKLKQESLLQKSQKSLIVMRQNQEDQDLDGMNALQNSQELFDVKRLQGDPNKNLSNAKSQVYINDQKRNSALNQSPLKANLNSFDKGKLISDQQIDQIEQKDNLEMASKKSQLEALQKQKPPIKQQDLIDYLMHRLQAAEESINTCEKVIQNEREIRKTTSTQLKAQIKELQDVVAKEKKTISDKVSVELDSTLKQAVREKIEIKKQLDEVLQQKYVLQKQYDDLLNMYNSFKEHSQKSEKLHEQQEKVLNELQKENEILKGEKLALQKSNIEKHEKMTLALKNHAEIKNAFLKLDEARFHMNQIMGPNGSLQEHDRKQYLGQNLNEHDQLLKKEMSLQPQLNTKSVQGGGINNPTKSYFTQAGIAGNQSQIHSNSPNILNPNALNTLSSPNISTINRNQQKNKYEDEHQDEDDFWYQGPIDQSNQRQYQQFK